MIENPYLLPAPKPGEPASYIAPGHHAEPVWKGKEVREDYREDPADQRPQKWLQIISGAISFCIGAVIIGAIFFGAASCSQKSKYADWDDKCENAFAHERDINDCKALGRNNAVLVAR